MQLSMGNYIIFTYKYDGVQEDGGMIMACSKVRSRIFLKELRKTKILRVVGLLAEIESR
jgi:hypothetical protein